MQRLQVVARGLVFVHASQPVAEEGTLNEMLGRGAGARNIHGNQRVVYLPVEAESAGGHGHPLSFLLGLVAHRLVGSYGIEHASLRPCQVKLINSSVIQTQRVFRGARALHSQ